jgi:hypothetical protein
MKDSKGHGSNRRGTHAQGVEKVGNAHVSPAALQTILKNPGGFTVNPKTGAQPTSGFMVSAPGRGMMVNQKDLSGAYGQKVLEDYARHNADAMQWKGAHIGGWTDSATGKTHLDISHNIRDAKAATQLGHSRNQIAIWDVAHSKEINTGGTGAPKAKPPNPRKLAGLLH